MIIIFEIYGHTDCSKPVTDNWSFKEGCDDENGQYYYEILHCDPPPPPWMEIVSIIFGSIL